MYLAMSSQGHKQHKEGQELVERTYDGRCFLPFKAHNLMIHNDPMIHNKALKLQDKWVRTGRNGMETLQNVISHMFF